MRRVLVSIAALFLLLLLVGTALVLLSREQATLTAEQGYGTKPQLPEPNPTLFPTVNVAEASGWSPGEKPTVADGFTVGAFAADLDHPRWLHVLPNGDVLVAETNKPAKEDAGFSLRGFAIGLFMSRAGAEVPSANRITLLRDADGDGVAEIRSVFLENLNSPFGMTLSKGVLYVANTDAVMAFDYRDGDTAIATEGRKIAELPAGPINHHWTKDVIANPAGTKLYATVGSNSNVGENGIEAEANRAAVLEIGLASQDVRLFASGLRNPNGLSWQPESGALWVAVNERDEIGSDLVPDYMTSVKDGGFYGWPYSYFGTHVDARVEPQRPDLVEKAIVPDYALGPHTASLGLTFYTGELFGAQYRNGAFVGQHGSWNRRPRSGYKVIFVPFANGQPSGPPKDILTGFIGGDDKARGRPVGVAVDRRGALLVADDVGNVIWRVSPAD
ncbi:PQQ-dependent sugar dehydrogenase [Ensifer canadensis]